MGQAALMGRVLLAAGLALADSSIRTFAGSGNFDTEPFSAAELLAGKRMTQAPCDTLSGAVWVSIDQQGECLRYYRSGAAGHDPIVVFSTDENFQSLDRESILAAADCADGVDDAALVVKYQTKAPPVAARRRD